MGWGHRFLGCLGETRDFVLCVLTGVSMRLPAPEILLETPPSVSKHYLPASPFFPQSHSNHTWAKGERVTNSLADGPNFMSGFYFLKINHTPHLAHLFFTVTEQVRTCKRELRGGAIFTSRSSVRC